MAVDVELLLDVELLSCPFAIADNKRKNKTIDIDIDMDMDMEDLFLSCGGTCRILIMNVRKKSLLSKGII